MPQQTIGRLWEAADGRPAGFDYLRLTLALSVILLHSTTVSYGPAASDALALGPLRPLICFILPSFFALSGFLVAGSLLRNDLLSFLTLRVVRIFPALVGEVIISALIIGPIFTTVGLGAYFTDTMFYSYLLNMIGYIHYFLPGVFASLPAPDYVNAQLWTVPYELYCYVLLAVLAVFALHNRPAMFVAAPLVLMGLLVAKDYLLPGSGKLTVFSGPSLVISFLFGVFGFLVKDRVKVNAFYLISSVLIYVILTFIPFGKFVLAPFAAYMTIAIGVSNYRWNRLIALSDCSYGVYLYGFPVQQVVSSLFPDQRVWWFNFLLAAAASLALGSLSWRLLESKFARRKTAIVRAAHGVAGMLSNPVAHTRFRSARAAGHGRALNRPRTCESRAPRDELSRSPAPDL